SQSGSTLAMAMGLARRPSSSAWVISMAVSDFSNSSCTFSTWVSAIILLLPNNLTQEEQLVKIGPALPPCRKAPAVGEESWTVLKTLLVRAGTSAGLGQASPEKESRRWTAPHRRRGLGPIL